MNKFVENVINRQGNLTLSFVILWTLINSIATMGSMKWIMFLVSISAFAINIISWTCCSKGRITTKFRYFVFEQLRFDKIFVTTNFICAVCCLLVIIIFQSNHVLEIISELSILILILGLTILSLHNNGCSSQN